MKKRHRIPPEVREQIIKRIKDEGVSVSQAAKDHGIHETTVYDWLSKGAEGSPSWMKFAKLKRENKALLELVGEITLKLSESQKRVDRKHKERENRPCGLSCSPSLRTWCFCSSDSTFTRRFTTTTEEQVMTKSHP